MSSFIRPALRAQLWRWREALAGLVVLGAGLWPALGSGGLVRLLGATVAVTGAALVLAGAQRGRFRGPGAGPGIVEVTEAQVAYFGPLGGGVVATGALLRVELTSARIAGRHQPAWLLTEAGQPPLLIPAAAANAEALFDVFAALPGFETERMLRELAHRPRQRVLIWQAAAQPRSRVGSDAFPGRSLH